MPQYRRKDRRRQNGHFSSPVPQFRYAIGAICSREKRRATSRGLQGRGIKLTKFLRHASSGAGSRSHPRDRRLGLSHKVTRKFITIVISPIRNRHGHLLPREVSDIADIAQRASKSSPKVCESRGILANVVNSLIRDPEYHQAYHLVQSTRNYLFIYFFSRLDAITDRSVFLD